MKDAKPGVMETLRAYIANEEPRMPISTTIPLTGPALAAEVENIVFGDDLGCFAADGTERWERVKDAVYRWSISAPAKAVHDLWEQPVSVASDRFLSMWDNRHKVESCVDLEAHVSRYRAAPRPFDRDPALALGLLGGESMDGVAWFDDFIMADKRTARDTFCGRADYSEFPDAPPEQQRVLAFCTAVCRAAIAKEQADAE